jgi:hypothetical protein
MFQNRIFKPKRYEVTGGWRKLHNKELHNFYSPPNIIKMVRSRRIVGLAGEVRSANKILVGREETVRNARCRWGNNVNTNLRETGQKNVVWIHLAEDR